MRCFPDQRAGYKPCKRAVTDRPYKEIRNSSGYCGTFTQNDRSAPVSQFRAARYAPSCKAPLVATKEAKASF